MSSHREIKDIRILEGNAALDRDLIVGEHRRTSSAQAAQPAPQPPDPRVAQLQQENTQMRADLQRLQDNIATMRITGPGFSGQGPRGILFIPSDSGSGTGSVPTGTNTFIIEENGAFYYWNLVGNYIGPV